MTTAELLKRLDAIRCWIDGPHNAVVRTAKRELDSLIEDIQQHDVEVAATAAIRESYHDP